MSRRIFPLTASLPLLFCLCSQFTNATVTDTIRPGQSLSTSEYLLSANSSFGLAFFSTENSTKHHVVIFYTKYVNPTSYIGHESIVWVANREHPFPNSSAVLTMDPDGNLVISDGTLLHMHMLTNTSGGNDTYARLSDTGNLILTNRASRVLWQSFDYPTDTLLPGMKLKDAKTGWSLTSWKNDDDPAPGLFSVQYLASRKELILMEGSEPYWTSSLNASGVLADLFEIDGENITWSHKSSPNEIRRIRLDISGNLLLQTWITSGGSFDWYSFCLPGFKRGTDLQYSNNINCTTTDTIRPGKSLNTSETIGSANGRYELGFFSPNETTAYFLGLWYYNSPVNVVWVANREDPFPNPVLTLDPDGNLVISDGESLKVVANTSGGGNDTYARLLDTGNLILTNRASHVLWQSFDYFTDSFLPGMKIKYDNDRPVLASWANIYYGGGPDVMLYVGSRKELILMKWLGPYWTSPLIHGLADIFVIDGDNITFNDNYTSTSTFTANPSEIRRVELQATGELQLQTWSYNDEHLNLSGSIKCGPYALCGNFSICNETAYEPCDCLPGFEGFAGEGRCKRKTELQCSDVVQKHGFLRMSKVFFPTNPQQLDYVGNDSECQSDCLNNCSCTGYAYDQEHRCLVWDGPLENLKIFSEDNTYKQDFYLKLDRSDLPKDTNSTNGNNKLRKIVIPTASIAVVVTLGLCVYYVRRKLRRKGPSGEDLLLLDLGTTQKANNSEHGDSREREVQMPLFSFASVSAATDNFSTANKLGEGGFGPVYKGILLNGDEVAVKRLSKKSGQGWEELKNEAMLIAKLQHKNLVRLLGCCIQQDEKILVYEYMPNKSLDFFLFDQEKRRILDWRTRVGVIEGIAQGLLYLHQYSRLRIIHRDLKPSNILLDIDMNPKISDFGMARIFEGNESQANTNRIVGTYGYMSPEYALEGLFSIKSDVFSFGVLLLEIVSGKKNTGFYQTDSLHLIGYAWELWTSDKGSDLVDPLLDDISSMQMVLRYVNIALLCVQESAEDRPTMFDIVAMLINESTVLTYPKEPAFLNVRNMSKANPVNDKPQICSLNGATISIMEGR